ncbi:MAG: hypothetical protein WAZ19_02025 [Anaerolineae bacterium]
MNEYQKSTGDRVGAIKGKTEEGIEFFGYGVYVGDHVPDKSHGTPGSWLEFLHSSELVNPKIELDNGQVVYGIECWWGSESAIREQLDGQNVVVVLPNRPITDEQKG